MDKYNLVLDIIEHPENYTSEQLTELLADPETREFYNLLCMTDSTVKTRNVPDVKAEWERFSERNVARPRRFFSWFGSRAASIAIIVCSSVVAVAAGIAVTVSVIGHKQETAQPEVNAISSSSVSKADINAIEKDSVICEPAPMMFEDEALEYIMKEIAEAYNIEVKFNNSEAASLHLYYKLDPSLPLNEVIEQLNTFEQINIRQDGNILIID